MRTLKHFPRLKPPQNRLKHRVGLICSAMLGSVDVANSDTRQTLGQDFKRHGWNLIEAVRDARATLQLAVDGKTLSEETTERAGIEKMSRAEYRRIWRAERRKTRRAAKKRRSQTRDAVK